jgi:hypothetical protein
MMMTSFENLVHQNIRVMRRRRRAKFLFWVCHWALFAALVLGNFLDLS